MDVPTALGVIRDTHLAHTFHQKLEAGITILEYARAQLAGIGVETQEKFDELGTVDGTDEEQMDSLLKAIGLAPAGVSDVPPNWSKIAKIGYDTITKALTEPSGAEGTPAEAPETPPAEGEEVHEHHKRRRR